MEKWESCPDGQHKWKAWDDRHYVCEECGAVGWAKMNLAFGRTVEPYRLRVTEYKCRVCGGPTTVPKKSCPNCVEKDKIGVVAKKKLKWSHLTPNEQKALKFLCSKEEPSTVSGRHGGRYVRGLFKKDLVNKVDNVSGQCVWALSEFGKKFAEENLVQEQLG